MVVRRLSGGQHLGRLLGVSFGAALLLAFAVAACTSGGPSGSSPEVAAEPISWTHYEVPPSPPVTDELLARGKQVYEENCAACHGEAGAGDGICAAFLLPHPRDFTTGVFRFKTTPGGALPTDEDLFRTVSLGLHSTGMPPWKFLLPDEDRWAVVHYIKRFVPDGQQAEPVDLGPEPEISEEMIAKGKELYAVAGCGKCHGDRGYGDGPSALTLVDAFGNPIPPRNFHKTPHFKRGHTLRDIALTIHTGNNGTPMPSFDGAFDAEQIWQLAAYVYSLGEKPLSVPGTPAAASRGEHLGRPDVVIKLVERHWKYVPDVIRVRQGQVVRIEFQPTDNGLGAGHGFAIDGYDKDVFINGAMVQRPKSVTFRADKAGTFRFYCASQCSTGPLHPNMNGTLIVEPTTGN